jgi:hypothetical protein
MNRVKQAFKLTPDLRSTASCVLNFSFSFQKGTACRPSRTLRLKSLKLEGSRFFIPKLAVCKFAIGKPKLDLVGLAVFLSDLAASQPDAIPQAMNVTLEDALSLLSKYAEERTPVTAGRIRGL